MSDENTPVVSEAPERRRPELWRTTQTPEGFRPSPRQQQRDARAYAEAWYAALRIWETRSNGQLVPRGLTPRSSKTRLMQPVVGNWGAGDILLRHTEVSTPMGWVSEAALSRLCNGDELLGRIRGGQGPASLLRPNGTWIHPMERAQAYGVAVLRLASALGNPRAGVLALHCAAACTDVRTSTNEG